MLGAGSEARKSLEAAVQLEPNVNDAFVEPFKLLQLLLVRPLDKMLASSVDHFFTETCWRHYDKNGNETRHLSELRELRGKNFESFVYWRDFIAAYRAFCVHAKLEVEESTDVIQAYLEKQKCTISQINVRRMYGIRWRKPDEPHDSSSASTGGSLIAQMHYAPSVKHVDAEAAAAFRSDLSCIRDFVSEHCKVTPTMRSFIDMETRSGPDGTELEGFRSKLSAYCKAAGRAMPILRGENWAVALPGGVNFHDGLRVMRIKGLTLPQGAPRGLRRVTKDRFASVLLTIVLDMLFLVLPHVVLVWHVLCAAHLHAQGEWQPAEHRLDRNAHELNWLNFEPLTMPIFGDYRQTFLVRLCVYETTIFISISAIRLLDEYLIPPELARKYFGTVHYWWRRFYGYVMMLDVMFLTCASDFEAPPPHERCDTRVNLLSTRD